MKDVKHIKQLIIDLKKDIDSNTLTVGVLNTTLSLLGRITRLKFSKEILF